MLAGKGKNAFQSIFMTKGKYPDFVIIGAQKCGTTSLHFYLGLHPQILMSKPKELDYFCSDQIFERGEGWYLKHFNSEGCVCGEASPNYSNYPVSRQAPVRMAACMPMAKLIYIVRDPVERAIAHYYHEFAVGGEARSIEVALRSEGNPYIGRSMYFVQLSQYLMHYPRDRVKIISSTDLKFQRSAVLREIFEFLKVDPSFHSEKFDLQLHKTSEKRRLSKLGVRQLAFSRRLKRIPLIGQKLQNIWLRPFSEPLCVAAASVAVRDYMSCRLSADAKRFRVLAGAEFKDWCL